MDIHNELKAMMDINLKPEFELAINEVIEKSYKADIEKLGPGMAGLVKCQWEKMKPYLFFAYCLGAKAQAVPEWISVEDRLPPCDFEFCETGEQVSNVVLIHSAATYGFNMGMGHVNEDGVWNAYSGEHDFMNVLNVTHWMPLPDAPQEPAND